MLRCQVTPEAPVLHIVRKDRFHKLFPDVSDSDVVIKCKLCLWPEFFFRRFYFIILLH